jgi:hypothetical protein
VGEDEMDVSSELLIRVNTETDLKAPNLMAFFSPPSPNSSANNSAADSITQGGKPVKKKLTENNPSASLRVQHSDVWLNQFIMPQIQDEEKARKLEAVGGSSNNLTPQKTRKQIETLRTNVENSHFAVDALELQLEDDLKRLKDILPQDEFLKLVARCLNLKKQALTACLQASARSIK